MQVCARVRKMAHNKRAHSHTHTHTHATRTCTLTCPLHGAEKSQINVAVYSSTLGFEHWQIQSQHICTCQYTSAIKTHTHTYILQTIPVNLGKWMRHLHLVLALVWQWQNEQTYWASVGQTRRLKLESARGSGVARAVWAWGSCVL